MALIDDLMQRSNHLCELCNDSNDLLVYAIPPQEQQNADNSILICKECEEQIEKKKPIVNSHWQNLGTSMWSEYTPVQVMSWRILNRLRHETWAAEHLEIMYLDDEVLKWAKAMGDHENSAEVDLHKDSNGNLLNEGDSVVLIKTLDVKGSNLSAKLGTVVKNIRLDPNNSEFIEGRVEGQLIVILTKFVRKQA